MKVSVCKTVDVDLDDCIGEMLKTSEGGYADIKKKKQALEGASRIMASLDPVFFAESFWKNPSPIKLLRERLGKWIEFLEQHREVEKQ